MTRSQVLLGTYVEVSIGGSVENAAQRDFHHEICTAVFNEMAKVQRLMSIFDSGSDIAKINKIVPQSRSIVQKVHPWTFELLLIAKKMCELTGGVFDCAVGTCSSKTGSHEFKQGSILDLGLDEKDHVRLHQPIDLDLGGIAKGYAVDRGIEILKSFGITQAGINAGGDLRIFGHASQVIFIQEFGCEPAIFYIGDLQDGAIATSSNRVGSRYRKCQQSMLIDPKSGKEVRSHSRFSVVAPTCVVADGLTKALAIEQNIHADYFKQLRAIPVITA